MKRVHILRTPNFALGILLFFVLLLASTIFFLMSKSKEESSLSKLDWVQKSIPIGANSRGSNLCFQLRNDPLAGKDSQKQRTRKVIEWTEFLKKQGISYESGYETAIEDFKKLNKPLRLTIFHNENLFLRVSYTSRSDEAWICFRPSAFDKTPVQVEWKERSGQGFYSSKIPIALLDGPLLRAISATPLFTKDVIGWSIGSFDLLNQSVFSLGALNIEFSFR